MHHSNRAEDKRGNRGPVSIHVRSSHTVLSDRSLTLCCDETKVCAEQPLRSQKVVTKITAVVTNEQTKEVKWKHQRYAVHPKDGGGENDKTGTKNK